MIIKMTFTGDIVNI